MSRFFIQPYSVLHRRSSSRRRRRRRWWWWREASVHMGPGAQPRQ